MRQTPLSHFDPHTTTCTLILSIRVVLMHPLEIFIVVIPGIEISCYGVFLSIIVSSNERSGFLTDYVARSGQRQVLVPFLKPHLQTVIDSMPTSRKYEVNVSPKDIIIVRSGFEPGAIRSRYRYLNHH